jgi:DNA primase
VALRRSGVHLVGRCPFHRDTRPSLVVYPETRSFFCFGCRAGGDVIDFVRRAGGLGFREAVARLEGAARLEAPEVRAADELAPEDRRVLTAACDVYHATLLESRTALSYLAERGVDLALARRCRLGYSDGSSLRPYLERRHVSVRRAYDLGLLGPRGTELMTGRLVIPEVRDGRCLWLVGRALDDRQPKYRGVARAKPILGYERVAGRSHVILTEGPFDYLTGVGWGLPICALVGTHVRPERLAFLRGCRCVVLAFDTDVPGRTAAAELAMRLGPRARVLTLPTGVKDLNELGQRPDGRSTLLGLLRAIDGDAAAWGPDGRWEEGGDATMAD